MDEPHIAVPFFLISVAVGYAWARMIKAHAEPRAQRMLFILGGLWLASVCLRANSGYYLQRHDMPPRMLLVVGPVFACLIWLALSSKATQFASKISQNILVGMQSFRIGVELCILALAKENLMPVEMTLRGYNYDIFPAITALAMAAFIKSDSPRWVGPIIFWNVLSMGILTVTVVTGMLSAPGPARFLNTDVLNRAPLMFPYILLPALLVPTAFALHILSIKKARLTLRQQAEWPA